MKNYTKAIRDSLIIFLITALLLILLEAMLRVLYPEKILKSFTRDDVAYQFHPQYLLSLKPNQTKTFIRSELNGGDTVNWKTNSYGFRGNDFDLESEYIISIYGDSNIQARFSSLKSTLAIQLKRLLTAQTSLPVEVINAGVIGFGPDQSVLKMKEDLSLLKPDLIVLHVFADNDFGDLIRNALFQVDSMGNLSSYNQNPLPDPYLETIPHTLWDRFLLVRSAKQLGRKLLGMDQPEKRKQVEIQNVSHLCESEFAAYENKELNRFSVFADHYDLDVSIFSDSESAKYKRRLMRAVLAKGQELANQNNIKLLILIQPSVQDLTDNQILSYADLERYQDYKPSKLSGIIEDICQQEQIDYINLFPIFTAQEPDNLYFELDDHWNDKGQALAADSLASFIIHSYFQNS